MGSRAVVIVCRDEDAARKRFGVTGGEAGIIYTRTGRRFFEDRSWSGSCWERFAMAHRPPAGGIPLRATGSAWTAN